MSMWSDLLKVIQLKPRYLFGLWLLGTVLLVLPTRLAVHFGVVDFRDHYRSWIGLLTLGAFSFWLVQLVPAAQRKRAQSKWKKGVLKNLGGLSPQERFVLAYCVHRGQRTVYLRVIEPAATSLCHKGLMLSASGSGSMLAWPYTIPDFVWDYIRTNRLAVLPEKDWNDRELYSQFEAFERDMQRRFY
jgi:hypothetical protein